MIENTHGKKVASALDYANLTAGANGNIIAVDGFDALTFVVQVGTVTTADDTNFLTVSMEHGDESDLSDAAAVTGDDIVGANLVINDTALSNKCGMLGYLGSKAYVRLVVAETGTAEAGVSAIAVQDAAHVGPVSDESFN